MIYIYIYVESRYNVIYIYMIYSCVKCYIIQSIYSQIIKKLEVDCYVFNSLLHVRTRSDSPGLAKNAGPSVVSQCDPRFDSTPHLKKRNQRHMQYGSGTLSGP